MMSKFKSYKVREKPLQPLHQLQRSHYQLHSLLTIKYIMSNKLAIYPKIFTKVVIFNIPKVVTPYTLKDYGLPKRIANWNVTVFFLPVLQITHGS